MSRRTGPNPCPPIRLLIVDDDADQREMYAEGLRFLGHDVLTASTSADALRIAIEAPLDAIVIDGVLGPFETGWALAKQLRAHTQLRSLPFVLLTAAALSPSAEEEIARHCDVMLEKPCMPDMLARHIEQVLRQALPKTHDASMTLYVSSKSPSSAGVEQRLRRHLQESGAPDSVTLSVHDLSEDPAAGAAEGITYTPSLIIRTASGERRVVIGDLQDRRALVMALTLLND